MAPYSFAHQHFVGQSSTRKTRCVNQTKIVNRQLKIFCPTNLLTIISSSKSVLTNVQDLLIRLDLGLGGNSQLL